MPEAYTVIADVIGSRRQPDRAALQRLLLSALDRVAADVPARQPLAPTVGDEMQGTFGGLPDAARAALLLRLRLHPVQLRCGIGHGEFAVFDASRSPISQDGPAWWAARAAIEEVKTRSARPHERTVRTAFRANDPPREAIVNAYLGCRDAILAGLSERSTRLLLGVLLGRAQREMAVDEGITQSAVSQALSRSGAWAVITSLDALTEAG